MVAFDLFGFYRFLLAVLVGCYAAIRVGIFVWHLQRDVDDVLGSALLRRYVTVLLLRMRLRGFLYELSVIGGLTYVLFLLVRLHWR